MQGHSRVRRVRVTAAHPRAGCGALLHRTWDRTPINGRLFSSRVALALRVPKAHPSRAQEDGLRTDASGGSYTLFYIFFSLHTPYEQPWRGVKLTLLGQRW